MNIKQKQKGRRGKSKKHIFYNPGINMLTKISLQKGTPRPATLFFVQAIAAPQH